MLLSGEKEGLKYTTEWFYGCVYQSICITCRQRAILLQRDVEGTLQENQPETSPRDIAPGIAPISILTCKLCLSTVIRGVVGAYPACVVDDGEVCLVLELFGLLELGVGALLLHQLVHKRLVCGFGEPTLLVQQGQYTRGVCLRKR